MSPRWPPTSRPPPRIRTPQPRHEEADPGTPGTASRCRRGARPRRPRHRLQPCAERREALGRDWPHPELRRRRPSSRLTLHRSPRRAHQGAHREGHGPQDERRRGLMRPSRTKTPATGRRGMRRSPQRRRAGRRHGSCESGSDGSFVVLAGCGSRLQSRQRAVASAYVLSDTPAICPGSSIGACAC